MKTIGLLAACLAICSSSPTPDVGGAEEANSLINSPNGVASLAAYGSGQRGARLVQSNEALQSRSINNLGGPNSLKDGPLTFNDQETILFPDKFDEVKQLGFAKDSYGNPVTPFALSDADVAQRSGAELERDTTKKDENGFVLPSYASGIIGFVDPNLPIPTLNLNLEPPLSNGNFFYPGVNSETSTEFVKRENLLAKPAIDLLPPLETTFGGSFSQSQPPKAELPATDLLPPFEGPQTASRFSDTQTQRPAPPTTARPRPVPPSVSVPVFIQTPAPPPPSASVPVFSQTPAPPPKKATVQKYTGGFGGAPGLLSPSNQPKPAEPSKVTFAQPSFVPLAVPSEETKVAIVPQPIVQLPSRYEQAENRYTGGFGGPPGLLTPFDNINEFARANTRDN